MSETVFGSFLVTFAVLQTIVLLVLIRFVDLYEREPLSMVGIMALWGAVGATALSAVGNTAFDHLLPARIDQVFGPAITAPVVEEAAKGIALIAFLLVSVRAAGRFGIPRFEGVTDGVVYGAAVGFGFAFTEDILFMLQGASEGHLKTGLVDFLQRRDFFGVASLRHAIFTACFGVALGIATWSTRRLVRVVVPVLGLLLAMALHAVNNGLVQFVLYARYGLDNTAAYLQHDVDQPLAARMAATAHDTAGIVTFLQYLFVGLFVVLVLGWLAYQRRVIRSELREEVASGLISRTEWDLMPSYWGRTLWYWQLIRTGQWERWRTLQRLHADLVGFAFLKRRARRTANGNGNGAAFDEVERKRQLISKLKTQKLVFL